MSTSCRFRSVSQAAPRALSVFSALASFTTLGALTTLASLASPSTAVASSKDLPEGVLYSRLGAQGEYPPAYKVLRTTTLAARAIPGPLLPASGSCTLTEGSEVVFARPGVVDEVITQTYDLGRLESLVAQDLEIWDEAASQPTVWKIAKGDVVEELSYLAEGFCTLRFGNTVAEGACPSSLLEGYRVLAPLNTESWASLICQEGGKAWVPQSELDANKDLEGFFYNPY
jgi:hypothetical protein